MTTVSRATGMIEKGWQLIGNDSEGIRVRLIFGETELGRAYLGLVVGRHPALSDRILTDPTVSRRHCRVGISDGDLFVEDLNSLNGSYLDDRPIKPFEPVRVKPGQRIELGRVTLTVTRFGDER